MITEKQKNELSIKACRIIKSKQIFKTEMLKKFSPSDVEKI